VLRTSDSIAELTLGVQTAGRPETAGCVHRRNFSDKDALIQAFEEVGGEDWLVELVKSAPRTFAMLLAKLIPHELKVAGGGDELLVVVKDYTRGKAGVGAGRGDFSAGAGRGRVAGFLVKQMPRTIWRAHAGSGRDAQGRVRSARRT
jgi:hypothetical protein